MTEKELVQLLGVPNRRLEAMRALVGGVTATELRSVRITSAEFDALVEGLGDPSAQVRWWSVQLLDHVPDGRAIDALVGALHDPVPRVRRNAAHALGCVSCKPAWSGELPPGAINKLQVMAKTDPNKKVRAEASSVLLCQLCA